eukprot:8163384-Alexandrium_andersonii.AAC.1
MSARIPTTPRDTRAPTTPLGAFHAPTTPPAALQPACAESSTLKVPQPRIRRLPPIKEEPKDDTLADTETEHSESHDGQYEWGGEPWHQELRPPADESDKRAVGTGYESDAGSHNPWDDWGSWNNLWEQATEDINRGQDSKSWGEKPADGEAMDEDRAAP